jgi:uncharacterized protein (TIGR00725 family)
MSHPPRRSGPRVVAVVGPADAGDDLAAAAYSIGRGLAEAGVTVVTGGLGGVMAAACRGAAEAGGATVGLLPGTDAGDANPWVTVAVPTGLGEGRNLLVVRAASVVVAVGGSWGTLSEVALACRTGVPVVALHGWQLADPAGAPPDGGPLAVTTPDEAVHRALDALAALGD